MTNVVTRIAPSPTGAMHIGTARTALFNYLYAKHMGGKFMLRVEDTDKERSTDEATEVIFNGLKWLGFDFDGEAVSQSARAPRHAAIALKMVEMGHAYYDFMSAEETDAWKATNKGKAFRSMFRDMPGPAPGMTRTILSSTPPVVRFKGPTEGTTVINDLVKGPVTFDNSVFDDLVLLRSDGTPTYNLAVVVDDHDMGITHVIRGDDHMNNAGRQALIYKAMGWDVPEFAHVPLIYGEDGKKLSKRHGATSVMEFADMGYLPEAMVNYLTHLGWGHGDDELFSLVDAIGWFDIKDVVAAPARFNWKKLNSVNRHYISQADNDRLAGFVLPLLNAKDIMPPNRSRFEAIIGMFKDGVDTLPSLADKIAFVFRPTTDDPKALAVLADPATTELLARISRYLVTIPSVDWTVESLNHDLRGYAEEIGVPMKIFGTAMRAAITGVTVAPDLGSCLVAIGKDDSIMRIDAAVGEKS